MRTLRWLVVIAVLISPARAGPDLFTAGRLGEFCEGRNFYDLGVCDGYAFAVAESLIADGTICLPAGVNMRQTAKIVGQFLVRNPEFHHQSPLSSAKVALMKAFLCPKKSQ
jgi:hypothetical protein